MSISVSKNGEAVKPHSGYVGATVIRCGCGNPDSHLGAVCPTPRKVERMGVVAATHHNPIINFALYVHIKYKEWKRNHG